MDCKTCSQCKQTKDRRENFYVSRVGRTADGFGSVCKQCERERGKARWQAQRRERPSVTERFWSHVQIGVDEECWLWTASTARGYGLFKVNGKTRIKAHRFAWTITNGPIPNDLWVLHRCDVTLCVNPAHLFLGTPLDNSRDCVAKGRTSHKGGVKGEAQPRSKLTYEKADEIRRARRAGETLTSLALRFNVGSSTIRHCLDGTTWKEGNRPS